MDVTWIVNGLDLSAKLSTFSVNKEIKYKQIVTTMDGAEHPVCGTTRTVLRFSLFPMTEEESKTLERALLDMTFEATYPENDTIKTEMVRLDSGIEKLFLLKSVDGKRRYRGGEIVLRGVYSAES